MRRAEMAFSALAAAITQEREILAGVAAGETFRCTDRELGTWQNERGTRMVHARCIKALARRGQIVMIDNVRAEAWPR